MSYDVELLVVHKAVEQDFNIHYPLLLPIDIGQAKQTR